MAHLGRFYGDDPRWVPPYYPALRWALDPARDAHIARMAPRPLELRALARSPRRRRRERYAPGDVPIAPPTERVVAAAVALRDPRRGDGAAYLTLPRCVNDLATLERLLDALAETLWPLGCRRLLGPTGLSPHLGTGLLQDHWDQLPPLHTPYQPPYLPELLGNVMQPLDSGRLYHLAVPPEPVIVPDAPAGLSPLNPGRLADELLPLLAAACPAWAEFPPPDAREAHFLLRWLSHWPLHARLAQVDGEAVGFVLLQPDLAPRLRRAGGGRLWPWRLWLRWAARLPVRRGRLLYGGVLPRWRGRGIGRQLLRRALAVAAERGWESLTVGPLPPDVPAAAFLQTHGARARQSYRLYQLDL